MLNIKINKSGTIVFLLVSLFTAGCSQQHSISYSTDGDPPTYNSIEEQPSSDKQAQSVISKAQGSAEFATVWDRMISLYAMPELDNDRIDHELKRYTNNPDYLVRIQRRAQPYMYAILEEIETKKLPGELALLPVVESAFKPHAYSRSKASGLWQFIPATGRYFGLKQNWWYDGRRDIHASTQMATHYLKELNAEFDGDWLLALASYNAGKGTVGRAIKKNHRRNKPTDYWSLPLPRETREYVPRLLAIAKIFANAEKYNIPLLPIPNKRVYEPVDIGSQLDLAKAAEIANMPMDDFFKLNPGFNRWCTAPDGPHRLLIPVDKVETFKANLALLPDTERMKWDRHRIKRGENLGLIATKYGTNVHTIRQANQLKSNTIHAGKYLLIPSSLRAVNKYVPAKKRRAKQHVYTVKKGDSLWKIARQHDTSSQTLARWNNLNTAAPLRPGQKLVLKSGKAARVALAAPENPFQTIRYTVKKGDSLFEISRKYNVSLADLRKWNAHNLGKHIHPGQKLKVLVSNTQPAT